MGVKTGIRYRFDVEKFVNAVAYFVKNTPKVDKLKVAKLLYFLDKYHLVHYGRPVTGDCYHSLDYGPVPSMSLDIINDAISGVPLTRSLPNKDMFEKYLQVNQEVGRYPVFVLRRNPDLDIFSKSECEALEHTVKEYGARTGPELINLTHRELTWKSVRNGEIDYRLFVADSPNNSELLELMELDEENQEIADNLNS